MFDRFKNRPADPDGHTEGNGRTAVADRPVTRTDRTAVAEPGARRQPAGRASAAGSLTRDHMNAARDRQRDEFGGINWGAAFFGWLVAVGLAALLTAILAAAGAALDLTTSTAASDLGTSEELSLAGAIGLLVVLLIAYYAGGYVAGRMSR